MKYMMKYISIIITGMIFFVVPFLTGCAEDPQEKAIRDLLAKPVFATEEAQQVYIDSLNGVRHFKDEWLLGNSNSPIKEEDRATFTGLAYYPVDLEYVFRTRLYKYDDPQLLTIGTTTGSEREAIRYGYIDFTVDGREARLYAYKFTAHQGTDLEEYLFIPFKDATSGTETYGGGRYIDVTETIPGVVLIDFNDAYNPYCVYNEIYSCPIPPDENHLDVAIRAGEKNYPGG
jgi:uncharacterized protein